MKGKANFVANLAPGFLDVDLGSYPPPSKASHAPSDLQFMQSGALLQVGVYANVAGVRLINFQVLRFSSNDASHFKVRELFTHCTYCSFTDKFITRPILTSRWCSTSTLTTCLPKALLTRTGHRLSRR